MGAEHSPPASTNLQRMRSLLTFCNTEGKQRLDCACACPAGMSLFFPVAHFPTPCNQVSLTISCTSTKRVIVNKSKDSHGKLGKYQEDSLLYLNHIPKERWNLLDIITETNPNKSWTKPGSPHPEKKPQSPTKPPTQATSSLESCSSISKTTIVLNCLKTRHWHYWTWEAGMWHSAHFTTQAAQPLRTPCGPLSEAVFCSEIRKTVWRYQNGFLSKDN